MSDTGVDLDQFTAMVAAALTREMFGQSATYDELHQVRVGRVVLTMHEVAQWVVAALDPLNERGGGDHAGSIDASMGLIVRLHGLESQPPSAGVVE